MGDETERLLKNMMRGENYDLARRITADLPELAQKLDAAVKAENADQIRDLLTALRQWLAFVEMSVFGPPNDDIETMRMIAGATLDSLKGDKDD
jgi:hypothetical protein